MEQQVIQRWLDEAVQHHRSHIALGQTAQYIPALAEQDPNQLGVVVIDEHGVTYKAGDTDVAFTLQSMSKMISFIAVCVEYGLDYVLEKVDVEATGDAFNSIIPFEIHRPNKPFNPLINAGAIIISSMLHGETVDEKFTTLTSFIESLIGKPVTMNEVVYQSEWETANRNRALAYYLKESNFLKMEVEEALDVYIRQCALEVSLADVAKISLIIAFDGVDPTTNIRYFPKEVARIAKVLMVTCGMYDSSGKFAAHVGIPAKSGVSGGIMAAAPRKVREHNYPYPNGCGIAVFSPALDSSGNSVAGTMLLKDLSQTWVTKLLQKI